jgi:hypothetical protein
VTPAVLVLYVVVVLLARILIVLGHHCWVPVAVEWRNRTGCADDVVCCRKLEEGCGNQYWITFRAVPRLWVCKTT